MPGRHSGSRRSLWTRAVPAMRRTRSVPWVGIADVAGSNLPLAVGLPFNFDKHRDTGPGLSGRWVLCRLIAFQNSVMSVPG